MTGATTLPQFSAAVRKAWKTELDRKLSAASSTRILALLERPLKTRLFSVPASFPWMESEPTKKKDRDDEEDDDFEEYPYEYVTFGSEAGHSDANTGHVMHG